VYPIQERKTYIVQNLKFQKVKIALKFSKINSHFKS